MKTALPLLLILAGCSTEQTQPPPPIVPARTDAAPARPLSCTEFPAIKFNPGKPGATKQDVLDALAQAAPDPNDPLAWVRGVVGDTKSTRAAISDYAAARRRICGN